MAHGTYLNNVTLSGSDPNTSIDLSSTYVGSGYVFMILRDCVINRVYAQFTVQSSDVSAVPLIQRANIQIN